MRKINLAKCHPDFHIPADAIVGDNFDASDYVKRMKESFVDSIVFFGKCHYGFAYYPTQIGTTHPGLKSDMLGEVAKNCRDQDLGISVYYSMFLDSAAVAKHPEWRLVADSMEIVGGFNSKRFEPLCVNSGYIEELLIPQSIEILQKYDVDELFYDTMTGFHPCYCDKCRGLFGKPIPIDSKDECWTEYVTWYKKCYDDCFEKVTNEIFTFNPQVFVAFNWQWSANQPDTPPEHVQHLAGDLFPSGSVSSFFSHYWAGTGLTFDYMCGRFMHGLGDWSNNTSETLKYTAAATIANGGGFYLIDRQLPDGTLEERSWPILKEVFQFVNSRRNIIEGTKHVPETAVFYSYDHIMGKNLEYYPDVKKREKQKSTFLAFSNIMMNRGHHYTALNKENLQKNIYDYKLIVLPELEFVDQQTKKILFEFVEAGGKLLVIQAEDESSIDEEILAFADVKLNGFSNLDYGYIENNTKGYSEPILLRGKVTLIKGQDDSKVLNHYIQPMTAGRGGAEFGHGFAPPADTTEFAIVSKTTIGKGEVIYVSAPVLSSFHAYYEPNLADLVVNLKDELLPELIAKINTKAQVEMVLLRKENDLIINLVNHSGKEVLAGYWCPVVEYVPSIIDIKVEVRCKNSELTIISEPEGELIQTDYRDGYIIFTAPPLHIMNSYLIKNYF